MIFIIRTRTLWKNAVSLILTPFLINIKKASYDDALNIINSWLSKCGKLRQLDQDFNYMVRYALKYSAKNGNRPLKLDTLKLKNKSLYDILQQNVKHIPVYSNHK
jgi:hypothetical protein